MNTVWIFVLALLLVVAGCMTKKEVKTVTQPKTIVFFGDSVTRGYGVDSTKESFFARIEKIMGSGLYGPVRVINAGVNGDDSGEALTRVSRDVTAVNPDIAVIAFGLNDCQNRSMNTDYFKENILNIIAAMPSKTTVLLATSNSFLDTGNSQWEDLNASLEPYMDVVREIAKERKLGLIDVNYTWQTQIKQDSRHMESYYVDPTHPSAKGHGIIYETYMNVLRRTLMD